MSRGRMMGSHRQLIGLRDEELRIATAQVKKAMTARKDAQDSARKLQEQQWHAAFLSLTDPERGERILSYHPYLERSMLRDLGIARAAEEKAEFHLTQARKADVAASRLGRKIARRQRKEGLWILFQVCLVGWRRRRARQYRSVAPSYHLQ